MFDSWIPRVYRFARRLTGDAHAAEDLTQETLLRAWHQRRQLRDPQAMRVWLFRIAANLWRDELRRRQRPAAPRAALPADCPDPVRPPLDKLADADELRRVLAALDELPDRQREVLYLNACEQLSLREVAEVLGISSDAAKASLSLARGKLRHLWSENANP